MTPTPPTTPLKLETMQLGMMPYENALKLMNDLHEKIVKDPSQCEQLLVTEHPSVITLGARPCWTDIKTPLESLKANGIAFAHTDRGGSATAHEEGQLVVYPLMRLNRGEKPSVSVKTLVWKLEEAMIRTCSFWGISCTRDPRYPGIWVADRKIGSIGLRVDRNVTRHGIALNITNSMETFRHITPCGITGAKMTSLALELGMKNEEYSELFERAKELLPMHIASLY